MFREGLQLRTRTAVTELKQIATGRCSGFGPNTILLNHSSESVPHTYTRRHTRGIIRPLASRSLGCSIGGNVNRENNATWSISPQVRSTYTEDGAVLLDIGKGLCYSLNRVAARVWVTIELSPGGITLEGIVDALESHFEIPREQLERDAGKHLEDLRQVGLARQNGHRSTSKAIGAG